MCNWERNTSQWSADSFLLGIFKKLGLHSVNMLRVCPGDGKTPPPASGSAAPGPRRGFLGRHQGAPRGPLLSLLERNSLDSNLASF